MNHLKGHDTRYQQRRSARYQGKPVVQYDLDGRLLRVYDSMAHASCALRRGKHGASSSILRACELHSTTHGYIWRYKGARIREQLTPEEVLHAKRGLRLLAEAQ